MPAHSTPRLLWNVVKGTARLFVFDPLGMLHAVGLRFSRGFDASVAKVEEIEERMRAHD